MCQRGPTDQGGRVKIEKIARGELLEGPKVNGESGTADGENSQAGRRASKGSVGCWLLAVGYWDYDA